MLVLAGTCTVLEAKPFEHGTVAGIPAKPGLADRLQLDVKPTVAETTTAPPAELSVAGLAMNEAIVGFVCGGFVAASDALAAADITSMMLVATTMHRSASRRNGGPPKLKAHPCRFTLTTP